MSPILVDRLKLWKINLTLLFGLRIIIVTQIALTSLMIFCEKVLFFSKKRLGLMGKKKATFLSLIFSVAYSIIIVILNTIYNNLMLTYYGSSVNGLVASVMQFVTLLSVFDGGLATAAIVACYKPIQKNQIDRVNSILATVKYFYRRIAIFLFAISSLLGFFFVHCIDSPYGFRKTYCIIVICALTFCMTIGELSRRTIYFQGCNKNFVVSGIASVAKTISWMLSIYLIVNGYDIILVLCMNLLNVFINIIGLWIVERVYCSQVSYIGEVNLSLIKGTKDVYIQKITDIIFNSTDLIILSIFVNFSEASVYNLYMMIYKAMSSLLSAIVSAPSNSLGQLFCESDKKRFANIFGAYWSITIPMASAVFTCTGILIIPFIRIYTREINDYQYVFPYLSILFMLYCTFNIVNLPFGGVLNSTGHFKEQNVQCVSGAIINILISIVLVRHIYTYGVIIGSFISMFIILFANIYQVRKVMHISVIKIYFTILTNTIFGVVCVLLSYKIRIDCNSYFEWGLVSIVAFLICVSLFGLLNLGINGKQLIYAIHVLLKKARNNNM